MSTGNLTLGFPGYVPIRHSLATNWSTVPVRVLYTVDLSSAWFWIMGRSICWYTWVNLNGKLIIGNICRPTWNNNSIASTDNFLNELSANISKLCKNNNNAAITGDINLDLLKIDERGNSQHIWIYLEQTAFLPQITYPTRISKVQSRRSARNTRNHHTRMSASLIDQVFCRLKYK